jgi:hypothetical protein
MVDRYRDKIKELHRRLPPNQRVLFEEQLQQAYREVLAESGIEMAEAGEMTFQPGRGLKRPSETGKKVLDRVQRAASMFPRAWVEKMNERPLTANIKSGYRADYKPWEHSINLSAQSEFGVVVHEAMHGMEQIFRKGSHTLLEQQQEFLLSRRRDNPTTGRPETVRRIYAGTNEWGIFDGFANPYSGKLYNNTLRAEDLSQAYEILTMGIQSLVQKGKTGDWQENTRADLGYMRFVFGVLSTMR